MKTRVYILAVYLGALILGLIIPALALTESRIWWAELLLNTLSLLVLIVAAFALNLLFANLLFPEYWWMAQISNRDIYEYDGIYFVGIRQSRQKSRLNRIVFGVDDKMRRWDLLFGLVMLLLIIPHLMGGYTIHGYYDSIFVKHPPLPETLHATTLSALPVAQELKNQWSTDPAFSGLIEKALAEVRNKKPDSIAQTYRKAQLLILNAFQVRKSPDDTFSYTPGDNIKFDRSMGAEAVTLLKGIMEKPEQERAGWSRGALALIGFFHLSDQSYGKSSEFFQKALELVGDGGEAGFSRYRITLLAAQSAMLNGDPDKAEVMLEAIIVEEKMPPDLYVLAMEHFAGAIRLGGSLDKAADLLGKTEVLYQKRKDRGGLARVHLRRGALALEEKRYQDASREMSMASSLAYGMGDGFTLNMVEWVTQFFPKSI